MKHFITKLIILILLALIGSDMYAYDFQVDGIYYNILSPQDLTVEVTYESSSNHNYSGIVNIPETVEYRNKTLTVTGIGKDAFLHCNNLKEVTISNQINEIGDYAFAYCNLLSKVVIPNSVIVIGNCTFDGCNSLTQISLPTELNEIGSCTFRNCSSLTQISLPNDLKEISNGLFDGCTNLKEIIIPTNVYRIGPSAFKNCASIETITIPGSVNQIGDDTFVGCSNLKRIVFEKGEDYLSLGKTTKVRSEDSGAIFNYGFFHDCPIEEVILNRDMSFNLNYHNGIKWVQSDSPFSWIDTLTKLTIGEQVTKIHYYLFSNCHNLVNIEVGENVTEIFSNAFENCSNVKKIIFGKKLLSIQYNALSGLEQLESIYVFSETPPNVGSQSLSNFVYTFADLYVPIGTKEQYKTKDFWKDFINIHEFDPTGIIDVTGDIKTLPIIFDINGRKLSTAKRGINIINGEKVLIK
jgi:hypothetical protein